MNTYQALSRAQHLVWLAQSVAKDVPLYNLLVTYTIKGDLDTQRFTNSLETLVKTSDVLQSVIIDEETDHPSQQRVSSITADCQLVSLADQQELNQWIANRVSVPLDPRVKMFDSALVSMPDNTHVFYWCQHHISTDGFNIPLLLRKLSALYMRDGGQAELVAAIDLDIPSYYQFLAKQRSLDGSARREKIENYWREKSANEVEEVQYFGQAFDHSHAKVRTAIDLSVSQKHAIETTLTLPGFKSIGRDMSLFALMATAMMVTGYRLHRKTDLNLGFPSHGRQTAQERETFGMFTAIGFLSLSLTSGTSFRDLARQIMREAMKSFSHLEAGVQTKASQSAYAASVNVLTADITHFAQLPVEVEWRYAGFSDSNSQLDLNVNDFSGNGDFTLSVDLASSVFSKQRRQTYVDTFCTVLNALLNDLDQVVSGFEIVDDEVRASLLQAAAGPTPDAIQPNTLHEHFAEHAKRAPEAVAIKDAKQQLSFTQLDQQANVVAAFLRQQGVQAGDAVGVCFKRSLQMYPAMLGVMKAGAVMVPLDPTYPSARLAYMVKDSGSKLVLSNQATNPRFNLGDTQLVFSENLTATDGSNFTPVQANASTDALYIMYTSGSTGLPKGVVGTHKATLNRFAWMWRRYPFQAGEVCCQKTALSFVDSIWELFGPLLQGVPIVVIADETVLDIVEFVDVLESEQISRLVVVPSYLSVILDSDIDVASRLRTLEYCIVSGEPLPLHVARGFLNKLGHCQLLNLYGSTEVTADVTADKVTHDKLGIKMPIGKPIDGVSIHIVDEQMKLMPAGAVGEICVAGAGLSGGYFERDELNKEKFVNNPFNEGLIFKTGDLGRLNNKGLIEHYGRGDVQLKIRGRRIESAEIEHAMLEYEHVKSAVLYVGEGDQLYGFYVVRGGEEISESGMLGFLQDRLPEYMIPKTVRIMQLPLLSNGKINRHALGLLIPTASTNSQENFTPRTSTEETLASLWKTTLGLAQVNIHADFFDLGGNSIAAMRIMVGGRKLGIELSLKEILEIGNIVEIGLEIDNNPIQHIFKGPHSIDTSTSGSQYDSLSIEELVSRTPSIGDADNLKDVFPLTSAQKGILFHLLLQGSHAPLYLAQIRCDLNGEMNVDLFEQAWNRVVDRHDMLRSVIVHEGLDEPLQIVAKTGKLDFTVHDFSDKNVADAKAACDTVAASSIARPIVIDQQPLMRIKLGLLSADESHLILEWHHILMDGWSVAVVATEALTAYAALVEGTEHYLPEVGRFKDHVSYLSAMDSEAIHAFWHDRLQGFTTPTPISKKDKSADLYARGNTKVLMDQKSTQRLYDFSRKCRVTPNSVVQAAWALLLAKYNDVDDAVFGFAVTGRSSGIANFETTVGMFVNSLPMRIKCASATTLYDWMQEIQQDQMDLIQYENSALFDIQQASELPANTTMFDSLLVYQNAPKLTLSEDFLLEVEDRRIHENSPTAMTVEVFPEDSLVVQVSYIEEMFDGNAVEQIISHFTNIIRSITLLETTALVSDIGMMSFDEIQRMSESFNQTQRDYPQDLHLADLVWQQAAMHPDKQAASFGDVSLSYRELTERADGLAGELQSRGIGPNDLVAVCLPRDADLLLWLLAVQRAGAGYLPLDPDYPQARITSMLADADAALLVTHSSVEASGGDHTTQLLRMDVDITSGNANPFTPVATSGDDLAYVIYTSGSTGTPSGVKISRKNMVNFLHSMQETPGLQAHDKLLAVTTVAFDISVLELFLPLITGASVDVAVRDLTFDGQQLAARIAEQSITAMQATPAVWRMLLAAGWEGSTGSSPEFKALVGGETLPRKLAAALLPKVSSLWNMYGPTETTVWSTCDRVTDVNAPISIGKPIANTQILILDGSNNLCPLSIPGELCIAGDGVALGYVNRDELSQEKFISHPLKPDSKQHIYRTGDLARWTEAGKLEFLGRVDNQVKLHGFRIELEEIESVLGEVAGIDHAVVTLINDADNQFLAAYIVADASADDIPPNDLVLKEKLRQSLPLHMVPSSYRFIDAVPRMPNGKVDRKALPDPTGTATSLADAANADVYDLPENQPITDTEKTLREIWETTLKKERISVNSNFFDMGGNSISAMRIMSACKNQDISLSILDIFNLSTIRLCALASDQAITSEGSTLVVPEKPAEASQHSQDDMARIAAMLKGIGS
ncbi:MAG: amino acid adenylation domain-containing protein [Granulosicoccaceae bacterium]